MTKLRNYANGSNGSKRSWPRELKLWIIRKVIYRTGGFFVRLGGMICDFGEWWLKRGRRS